MCRRRGLGLFVASHVGCTADHRPPAVRKEAIRQVWHSGVPPVRFVRLRLWTTAVSNEGIWQHTERPEQASLDVQRVQTCVNAHTMMKMQSPMWNT